MTNADEVRKRLGLAPEYSHVRDVEAVKIAVLDYGFDGVDGVRAYLPPSTVVVEHYDPDFVQRFKLGDPEYRKDFEPLNRHGRTLAQIVWAVTGSNPRGPQFFLLNANGPTMLRRAVRYAIEKKVDIILFSGSFEGGGNGDGRGPVNRIVADALNAGIIWVNAAGNYGRRVYNGPVRISPDGYLRFREGPNGTALRFRNRLDENAVTVTLTWNDYQEKEDAGTTKDLDLYVENWAGTLLGAGEKQQVTGRAEGPNQTLNPRERVVLTDLAAHASSDYRIRVRQMAGTFTQQDRVRVLITAKRDTYVTPNSDKPDEAVKFIDASGKGELYPPADHPLVLTVGDSSPDSSIGPTEDHRLKPEVILEDSRAFFSDGQVSAGSSNAAAYFTGIVAVLKAAEPKLSARHLFRLARQDSAPKPLIVSSSRLSPRVPERAPLPAVGSRAIGSRSAVELPYDRTTASRASSSTSVPSAFAALRAERPEVPPALERRVWRTPSRTRLAQVVRESR
jgi:hypothetical protein